MRYALLLVLLVGCAEADNASTDAPPLGTAHDGATETGGADGGGRVCDAAVETLSGTATYVAGSGVAADPDEQSSAGRCGDLLHNIGATGTFVDVRVMNGMVGNYMLAIVDANPTSAGCSYTLRMTAPYSVQAGNCLVTRDYLLVAP